MKKVLIGILIGLIVGLGCLFVYNEFFVKKDNVAKTDKKEATEKEEVVKHKDGNLYKSTDSTDVICSTDSRTPYAIGTKYTCDNLGDGKSYIFYVLNDATNQNTVDLIMNKDYAKSTYINSGDYTEANNASLGPINAIKSLPTLSVWSNLQSPKDNSGYDYSQYAARLPMANEIANACGITNFVSTNDNTFELKNNNCNFLWENTQYVDSSYNYNGYLTSTPLGTWYHSWVVYSTNMTKEEFEQYVGVSSDVQLYDTVLLQINANSEMGIRPVISLYK